MEKFIAERPGVIITLLSIMVGTISVLLGYLLWRFQDSIDDLKESVMEAIKELKQERKEDRVDIGSLLDRMSRQETICESYRNFNACKKE